MTCDRCNGRGWYEDACENARWCDCRAGVRLRATPLPTAAQGKFEEINRKIDKLLDVVATPLLFVRAIGQHASTEETKIERDRLIYGTGYGRQRADGTLEHIPAAEVVSFHRVDTSDPEGA